MATEDKYSFLNGTKTATKPKNTDVYDPNAGASDASTQSDGSENPTLPPGEGTQPGPDVTVTDQGGTDTGSTDPNNPVPPTQNTVPDYTPEDYSGEVGQNTVDPATKIDTTPPPAGDVPFVTSSGTAEPTMTPWEVTREQTVQGQLTDLYNRDSPFFETARQRAIRSALSGGAQNSAMAGAFGELAAMDEAFKVGFADAQTYAQSAQFNAQMANQFSLAEQQFVHNALLSDQNYRQARELQTQRIAGQLKAIVADYQGRSALMDQELQNWFTQAKQAHEYQIDLLYEQGALAEGQSGRDFARTMVLNGMNTMTNFYTNAFAAVMQYANNPNFTPEQQKAAMENGMAWAQSQWDMLQAYWGQWAAGGPPMQSFLGGTSNWYDWSQPYTGG